MPTSCFSKSRYGDWPKDRSVTDAGRQHHDQAEAEQQRGDADDQVVRRERPVEQRAPGAQLLAEPWQPRHGPAGGRPRRFGVLTGLKRVLHRADVHAF